MYDHLKSNLFPHGCHDDKPRRELVHSQSTCITQGNGSNQFVNTDLQTAMTHELGHAFGLAHPTLGPLQGVAMECTFDTGEVQLRSADDLNGEMYLYSGHPQDFFSPRVQNCTDN